MKNLMRTFILLSLLGACSNERGVDENPRSMGTTLTEMGEDARQEVCEMVDGKLECTVERAKRDVNKAIQ
jgi:hypothetical protein